MYITGEQMMEDDGKLVIGLRGSNRFECAKFVHSRQHRMGIADEHCQHVGILSRERGSVEIRSTDSVRTVYCLSPRGAVSPGLSQSGLGLRVCVEPWKETPSKDTGVRDFRHARRAHADDATQQQ